MGHSDEAREILDGLLIGSLKRQVCVHYKLLCDANLRLYQHTKESSRSTGRRPIPQVLRSLHHHISEGLRCSRPWCRCICADSRRRRTRFLRIPVPSGQQGWQIEKRQRMAGEEVAQRCGGYTSPYIQRDLHMRVWREFGSIRGIGSTNDCIVARAGYTIILWPCLSIASDERNEAALNSVSKGFYQCRQQLWYPDLEQHILIGKVLEAIPNVSCAA